MQRLPHESIASITTYLTFAALNALACCSSLRADCDAARCARLREWGRTAAPLLAAERAWLAGPLRPGPRGFATLRYRTVARRRLLTHAEHDPRLLHCRADVVAAACDWGGASWRQRHWFKWYVVSCCVHTPLRLGAAAVWLTLLGSGAAGPNWRWQRRGEVLECTEDANGYWHLVAVLTATQVWPTSWWAGSRTMRVVAHLDDTALQNLAAGPAGTKHQLRGSTRAARAARAARGPTA